MEKKEENKKVVKVITYKGSRYTIDVESQDVDSIQGIDKFGMPIKLQMSDIQEIIPLSGTYGKW